jgi:phosphoribosylformimino-5-aminoimidazole carboxamide ribotide isomerase
MNNISIEQIRPELTWRLRQQVLYPQQKLHEMEMDEDNNGYHFGAFRNNKLVGVVSLFQWGNTFQFRKFAVDPSVQRIGVGSALLQYITDFAINEDAERIWCNARLSAIPFYLKHDFVQTGETFSKNGFDYEILDKNIDQKVPEATRMKVFKFLIRLVYGVQIGVYVFGIILMQLSKATYNYLGYLAVMMFLFIVAPVTIIFTLVIIYYLFIKRNPLKVFKKEFIYIAAFIGVITLAAIFYAICPSCDVQ